MVYLIPQGGLGNLILQHNAAYAFARETNQSVCIVKTTRNIPDRPDCTFYATLFRHVTFTDQIEHPVYREPRFMYDPIPSSVKTLDGYFQSWKYFAKYETELRDLFVSNERETYESMKQKYHVLSQGKPTTCVHIRRGDYLNNPTIHQLVNESFFAHTINRSRCLLVFSDSLDMIRDWDLWKLCEDVHFVEDVPGALETLFLMSLCDDFIISNSTLSLCAYFMRAHRDAQLTVHATWFGPDGPTYRIEDIVPPGTNIVSEPIILFYTCMANQHKWVNNTEGGIIVTGDPTLLTEYVWNPETKRLIVRCPDDYEGLPYKTFQAIKAIRTLFNPRLIIKQDDDVIITKEKFEAFKKFDHQYFGKVCVMPRHGLVSTHKIELFQDQRPVLLRTSYCAGPLYGLGYHAIRTLCERMDPSNLKYEDALVGQVLHDNSIDPVHIPWTYTHDHTDASQYASYCSP